MKSASEKLCSVAMGPYLSGSTEVGRYVSRDPEGSQESPVSAAWTTPEELGAAMLYLCSDEAKMVNGARLPLFDGGA